MTYAFNPYYIQAPYQMSPFVNAMQQAYNTQAHQVQQPVQQVQQQPTQQQQITTQPPVMQPQAIIGGKILPVTNKEEATVAPVDLVQGTPSFFYNKSNGEIYLKQFDVPTGTAIFKTYVVSEPTSKPVEESFEEKGINTYQDDFNYLKEGIDGLYRVLADMTCPTHIKEKNNEVIDVKPEFIEEKNYKNKKRGQ